MVFEVSNDYADPVALDTALNEGRVRCELLDFSFRGAHAGGCRVPSCGFYGN